MKKEEKADVSDKSNKRTVCITLISLLPYLGFLITLFIGFLFIGFGFFGSSAISEINLQGMAGELIGAIFPSAQNLINGILNGLIIFGFIFLVISALFLILGINFSRGKEWARMVVLALLVLGLIPFIIALLVSQIPGIILIVLDLTIISYLLFSKRVKAFFS